MKDADQLTAKDHRRIAELVGARAGIQLPAHKKTLIETRLRGRVRRMGCATLREYLDYALSSAGSEEEQVWLIDALTTNKTDFFREPAHFEFLAHHVRRLPVRGEVGWKRPLSVWSAACSSGEEPYTLALVLAELTEERQGLRFTIDATDIAPSVLETARRATYPEARVAPVPLALRRKYFLRSRDPGRQLVRMGRALRERVNFSTFNLITGDYSARYDVIFCRNVMIYFSAEDRRRIIARLHASLRPGGLLFIGHSESIGDQRHRFETLKPTIYRRLN